ncbi:MAG: hypothetical protein N2050_07460 [Flavobacteriales bacterium]|nr:hypothetical protein [Flavobacteriales bacterium]MCX7650373.1 hypothetical protein [Flavobacteriales bacterium]MDW8432394.1 hypothetical protein [Flavobacteriales bacterium]
MKIENFISGFFLLFSFLYPCTGWMQIEGNDIYALMGKSVKDEKVAEFLKQINVDPESGISYENGVRVYIDGNRLVRLYLYFDGWLEGKKINTFKWKFPNLIHENYHIYDAERQFGQALEKDGRKALFVKDGIQVEIMYKDDEMLHPSYVHLMK